MEDIYINEHAFKHGLSEGQILHAWRNHLAMAYRGAPNEGEVIAVGFEQSGKAVQMVASIKPYGTLIYHAMTPPTNNALRELGIIRS